MNLAKFCYQYSHKILSFRNQNSVRLLSTIFHKDQCFSLKEINFTKNIDGYSNPLKSFISYKNQRFLSIETSLDEKTYEAIADKTLDLLSEKLEAIVERIDPNTSDIVFNNGVITLSLGPKGTFVINKQTPNRQIWLSSPISGPKRYDYMNGQWIYKHDGKSLEELLKAELEQLYETSVDF